MIVSVDAAVDFTALLEDQIPVNPFACRISSLFRSYAPTYPFVDYWLQTSDDGIVTGAIARYGADYIVSLTEDSDNGEVSSFLEMAGASSVLCSDKTLSLELPMQSGWILTRRLPFAEEKQRFVSPDLREAFALLQSCAEKDFQPPSFADFYVDV
ncbi:MAG: hypothetical protein IJ598_05755, partial [Ruminococcus sp.]|nr:hypothetical protein [Ruminococcus sp.]